MIVGNAAIFPNQGVQILLTSWQEHVLVYQKGTVECGQEQSNFIPVATNVEQSMRHRAQLYGSGSFFSMVS